jgi:hypothetical protein
MGKIVDLQAGRARHGFKHADERAARLKDALRAARQPAPDQAESTRKLLAVFKPKPVPKP